MRPPCPKQEGLTRDKHNRAGYVLGAVVIPAVKFESAETNENNLRWVGEWVGWMISISHDIAPNARETIHLDPRIRPMGRYFGNNLIVIFVPHSDVWPGCS